MLPVPVLPNLVKELKELKEENKELNEKLRMVCEIVYCHWHVEEYLNDKGIRKTMEYYSTIPSDEVKKLFEILGGE